MDLVIPIVFPDYLIAVTTPKVEIRVPDLLPFVEILPDYVKIPSRKYRVPELGHAGALIINGRSGVTKYYEYGRYDPAALGTTRRITIPNVRIGSLGRPTKTSLRNVLRKISTESGQSGRIEGAYIETATGKYSSMLAYAEERMSLNSVSDRSSYGILTNSCMHFVKSIIEKGDARIPWIVDPRPTSFIEEVRSKYPGLSFRPPDKLTITGVDGD